MTDPGSPQRPAPAGSVPAIGRACPIRRPRRASRSRCEIRGRWRSGMPNRRRRAMLARPRATLRLDRRSAIARSPRGSSWHPWFCRPSERRGVVWGQAAIAARITPIGGMSDERGFGGPPVLSQFRRPVAVTPNASALSRRRDRIGEGYRNRSKRNLIQVNVDAAKRTDLASASAVNSTR
jgi:hypothetical protein